MKRNKTKFAAILAGVLVCLGIGVAPITANAEEVAETPVISTEKAAETPETDIPEEVPETDKKVENSAVTDEKAATEEAAEITLEDILTVAGKLAEEAGVGDDWEKAVENLKNAASEKKVDTMTILSAICIVIMTGYILGKLIYSRWKRKRDTTSADVKATKTAVGNQTKAINVLIEEEEKVSAEIVETAEREKQLAIAGQEQNAALRCLFRGVQLKQDVKDEAMRHLNNSDEYYDVAKKSKSEVGSK